MKDTSTTLNWPDWPVTNQSKGRIHIGTWAKLGSWLRMQKIKIFSKSKLKNVSFFGKMVVKNKGILQIGQQTIFHSDFQTTRLAIGKNATLFIGKNCFMNSVIIAANTNIEIGNNCHFAPFVHLMDSDFHDLNDRSLSGKSAPILIGNNVQLGARVIVLRGVKIGNNAVVLSGSVVTKDIPDGAKSAGVPAVPVNFS